MKQFRCTTKTNQMMWIQRQRQGLTSHYFCKAAISWKEKRMSGHPRGYQRGRFTVRGVGQRLQLRADSRWRKRQLQ